MRCHGAPHEKRNAKGATVVSSCLCISRRRYLARGELSAREAAEYLDQHPDATFAFQSADGAGKAAERAVRDHDLRARSIGAFLPPALGRIPLAGEFKVVNVPDHGRRDEERTPAVTEHAVDADPAVPADDLARELSTENIAGEDGMMHDAGRAPAFSLEPEFRAGRAVAKKTSRRQFLGCGKLLGVGDAERDPSAPFDLDPDALAHKAFPGRRCASQASLRKAPTEHARRLKSKRSA